MKVALLAAAMILAGLRMPHRERPMIARKLWFPYRGVGAATFGRGLVMPPPRLVQLARLVRCALAGHEWGRWRVETETWFEYVDGPERGAMRGCRRDCGTIEHAA